MIRRASAGLFLAAAVASIVPSTAFAGHCDDQLVIFSYPAGINSNAGLCLVAGEDLGDTRIINPASNAISIRFLQDFGADVPAITVVLDGLGFDSQIVPLQRTLAFEGTPAQAYVYDSADLAIDPTAMGCITAVLGDDWGGADNGETAFHTVGSTC